MNKNQLTDKEQQNIERIIEKYSDLITEKLINLGAGIYLFIFLGENQDAKLLNVKIKKSQKKFNIDNNKILLLDLTKQLKITEYYIFDYDGKELKLIKSFK